MVHHHAPPAAATSANSRPVRSRFSLAGVLERQRHRDHDDDCAEYARFHHGRTGGLPRAARSVARTRGPPLYCTLVRPLLSLPCHLLQYVYSSIVLVGTFPTFS